MNFRLIPYSFSKLDLLLNKCPRLFYLRYIKRKEPELVIDAFIKGRENHKKIQDFLQGQIDEIENKKLEKLLREIRENYAIQIEVYLTHEIEGAVVLEGYADIIAENDEEVLILDIKSRYNTIENGLSFGEDVDIQLSLYANLLKTEKEKKVGIIAVYNEIQPIFVIPFEKINKFPNFPSDFYSLLEKAEKRYESLEKKGFVENYVGCDYCEYLLSCKKEDKDNAQDIMEIAQQLRLLELKVKDLKEKVKNYCETHGVTIKVGDYEYGFFPESKTVYDKEKVISYLVDKKRYDLINPDLRKIAFLADDELLNMLSTEYVYTFRGRRTKDDKKNW
ncbi:MAG: PD-(D/E)XK nuclease family protein [Thermodesulfovibrio sp.]|nr:PD-(D/E)XK nuclease family protein [Thermodesulfovibrio sp.]